MTKLLNRQFKLFAVFAFLILVCSIPVYYYVIEAIWIEELDEHNQIIKNRITAKFSENTIEKNQLSEIVELWNILEPGTKIVRIQESERREDTYYEITKANPTNKNEIDRFRVLTSDFKFHDDFYRLTVETNIEESGEIIVVIGLVTFSFFLLMLIGFIILNRRISAKVWRPFKSTLDQLRSFRLAEEKEPEFNETKILEFAELNEQLKKLIKNNLEVYQKQKRFVENASHELQTPLAVLKSKLDLIMQSDDLTENQAKLLNAISLPLSRMTRLNKNLLILAKIENEQFSDAKKLKIGTHLKENIELLEDYFQSKKLEVIKEMQSSKIVIANPFLVDTMISNLLTNAIKFAREKDVIEIKLQNDTLSISNSGEHSLEVDQLCERFTNVSEGSSSSGLGLAIVKEICGSYNWKLRYRFENKRHFFSVEF